MLLPIRTSLPFSLNCDRRKSLSGQSNPSLPARAFASGGGSCGSPCSVSAPYPAAGRQQLLDQRHRAGLVRFSSNLCRAFTGGHLQYCRALARAQTGHQNDLAVREFQRIVVHARLI
jgi:hypothetical protein